MIGPDYEVYCPGFTKLGQHTFHCWKRWGHGRLRMVDAIAQSCDVYFYELARQVGVDAIAAMAHRFGLGAPLGIDLPGERAGLVPDRAWKLATQGVPWQKGETLVVGIGQGFMQATPLQLAVMAARIANGGFAVVPGVQTRLMDVAGEAHTLAAALSHSAFNLANALGAWLGGASIAAGYGWTSTGLVGAVLGVAGFGIFLASVFVDRVRPAHLAAKPAAE